MAQALLGHHSKSRRLRYANKRLGGTLPYPPRRTGRNKRLRWQQWPAHLSATVPDPAVPAHDVLALCAEASATLGPWLDTWETHDHHVADRHLAEAAAHWEDDLLGDQLPWEAWDDTDILRTELATWLVRHAPARLRAQDAPEELLHRIRLIGLTGPARWEDPHWPHHRY